MRPLGLHGPAQHVFQLSSDTAGTAGSSQIKSVDYSQHLSYLTTNDCPAGGWEEEVVDGVGVVAVNYRVTLY